MLSGAKGMVLSCSRLMTVISRNTDSAVPTRVTHVTTDWWRMSYRICLILLDAII